MSLCDCNQGRLPCTCKTTGGEKVMKANRYYAGELPSNDYVVKAHDFDRVTAERDALQQRLDDMNGRFVRTKAAHLRSCRLAIAKNQLAKQRHAEVIGLQELLNVADQQVDDLRAQLSERDTLLRRWLGVVISDYGIEELEQDTNAALSASAEPKCSKCGDSGVIDDKGIDDLPGGYCTERGLVACPDCEELSAPVSSTSDKYKAELYDEVWQLARDMGFGNVTDALMKLQSQLQGEPPSYKPGLYAVRHIDNWDGERDVALTFANLDADGKWTDSGTGDALLAYRGDKILRAWPLDCSDAPGAQIIGVPRNWLEDWALELVEAAQDGGQMSNQVEHLLQLYPKQ